MTDKEAMKQALEALELAQDNLRDHGDNCYLHDEGEYNRCFCGKDSLSGFLQEQVESLSQAIEQAEKQEPVAFNAGVPPLYPEMKDGETISVEYTTPPQRTEQEPVAHLWECLGRWSAYLVDNGERADCSPPSWLVDAVKNATTPQPQEFVCSTGLCHFTLTQTNVGIGERGMEAYEAAKERGWVGLSDERLMEMPEQEPVGYVYSELGVKSAAIQIDLPNGTPLYTHPPQRTWVGLTDEDWDEIFGNSLTIGAAIKNTEAKLKEKNCL